MDSRIIYTMVARSLSYIARRVVTKWEHCAVTTYSATPDNPQLLEIERNYYLSLVGEFDEEAVASIGNVGDMPIADFYRNVVKAPEHDVDFQLRYTSRATSIIGGFSKKHLPRSASDFLRLRRNWSLRSRKAPRPPYDQATQKFFNTANAACRTLSALARHERFSMRD
ncbi:hypothetical protein HFN89_04955 [Rhizobium laguerreae]|nr:hypothetical protein [Rhizobium laguerreae]